jgi:hypothetical protein
MAAAGLLSVAGVGCDTAFLSDNRPGAQDLGGAAPAGASLDPAAPAAEQTPADIVRDIEEADIVKVAGDKIYALNSYKGLLVIDASNPDAPVLAGVLDLRGRGVEMYVVGTRVYIVLSADYYYPMMMGGDAVPNGQMIVPDRPMPPAPDFQGSQLAIVDVSNPAAPALDGKINLVGFAAESRRVGNIIYVIGSNIVPYMYGGEEGDTTDEGFVASINVADPENIIPVERQTFSGSAMIMHTSATALFAASQEWDYQADESHTRVQAVDISDPAGAIVMRDAFDVPGTIRNRFYMDAFEGVFRIATESWGFGFREVRLYTYSLADMSAIALLGQVRIMRDESLEAVRFDGPRGYAVTFLRTDPLFVLDLHDAANPVVAGHLEVPGFSTHIEPRGSRLIAVGVDDTDGRRPAVAYYDVQDPANPAQLGRVVLGPPGSFTESQAVYDEKAFKIVDELGLIAIPFKHVEWSRWGMPVPATGGVSAQSASAEDATPDTPACFNAVQLVDFNDTGLLQRGWFEHRGWVERVGLIGDRLFAISQVALQTVDISDRDLPTKVGQVDFFAEGDLPYYIDDCTGYFDGTFPPGGPTDPISILIQVFLNGDMCGTISALPGAILPLSMFLLGAPVGARRRRKD